MSNVFKPRGPEIGQKEPLSVEGAGPPTKEVRGGQCVCVSSRWGEETWKPLSIPAGIFPSPFGKRHQHLSGEISSALSRSEKFLRGILVLGKRNQTQLLPSGPMLLIKPTELSSAGPAWGHGWGWSRGAGANFYLWLSGPRPPGDFRGSC